jgi:hypothetical protein
MTFLEDWEKATATRAEQIAQLARYAAIDNVTEELLEAQHAVIHNLFVQTELVQSLVYAYEGSRPIWNSIASYSKFNSEVNKVKTPLRHLYELEYILALRKSLIRDIVLSLSSPITRISIELDRHKLIQLAQQGKELKALIRQSSQNWNQNHLNHDISTDQTQEMGNINSTGVRV